MPVLQPVDVDNPLFDDKSAPSLPLVLGFSVAAFLQELHDTNNQLTPKLIEHTRVICSISATITLKNEPTPEGYIDFLGRFGKIFVPAGIIALEILVDLIAADLKKCNENRDKLEASDWVTVIRRLTMAWIITVEVASRKPLLDKSIDEAHTEEGKAALINMREIYDAALNKLHGVFSLTLTDAFFAGNAQYVTEDMRITRAGFRGDYDNDALCPWFLKKEFLGISAAMPEPDPDFQKLSMEQYQDGKFVTGEKLEEMLKRGERPDLN